MPNILLKAVAFAAEKHKNQRRKDTQSSPYINHPIALANLLAHEGEITNNEVLCAALLHDTIEDTQTTQAELIEHFGVKIASIVMEVSDNKFLSKEKRKQAQIDHTPHISLEAKLVKLADKICNLRDVINAPPKDWSIARRVEYFDWASQVVKGVKGINPNLEEIFENLMAQVHSIK